MKTTKSEVEQYANFSTVRYAQCWEDCDILTEALAIKKGGTYLSIASAGDNALGILAFSPQKVIAVDLNPVQIYCVELRCACYRALSYEEFLAFLGVRPSAHRLKTYHEKLMGQLSGEAAFYWSKQKQAIKNGFIHAGKFENYFKLFRKWVLPLVHSRETIISLMHPRDRAGRLSFYLSHWNTQSWQRLFRLFFSRQVMGKLGRDRAFFRYVDGPVARRILLRAEYALTELAPAENPYLHYILTGGYPTVLPFALRRENFERIRCNLDRLELKKASVEEFLRESDERFDGYNLSDVFEYMSEDAMEKVYEALIERANHNCRVVYWNMLAPRSCPDSLLGRVSTEAALSDRLYRRDKAFFYSRFLVETIS